MTDKIREEFDAWIASVDKRRDANGWEPLTARDVNMLREGYMEAALAQQPAPAAPVVREPVALEQRAAEAHALLRRVYDSGFDDDCVDAVGDFLNEHHTSPAAEQPDAIAEAKAWCAENDDAPACAQEAPSASSALRAAEVAMQCAVSVMENELAGLPVIQPELAGLREALQCVRALLAGGEA